MEKFLVNRKPDLSLIDHVFFFFHLVDDFLNLYMCTSKYIVYVYSKICIFYLYIREKLRETILTNPKIVT